MTFHNAESDLRDHTGRVASTKPGLTVGPTARNSPLDSAFACSRIYWQHRVVSLENAALASGSAVARLCLPPFPRLVLRRPHSISMMSMIEFPFRRKHFFA